MKRLRLQGRPSAAQFCSTSSPFRPSIPFCQRCSNIRYNSTQAAAAESPRPAQTSSLLRDDISNVSENLEIFRSPPPQRALQSAKLAALHARLSLPQRFTLQSLARCLVDATADPDPRFNNSSLAILGGDLLGYYCSEHLICNYPRLPIEVLWAAQRAYIGPEAMWSMVREWGIEVVAAPGGEVDPGLLQYQPKIRTDLHYEDNFHAKKREAERQALLPSSLRRKREPENAPANWTPKENRQRITNTFRVMIGDQFGLELPPAGQIPEHTNVDAASLSFVRALVAGVHMHSGAPAAKQFFKDHFLSRSLDMAKLFQFDRPNRDLLLLCKREGFEIPIARLISETGRLSAHPVYVVGVFSGRDKLGEGVGGSLAEAKTRAAVAALKSWYLYKPLEVTVPSEAETPEGKKTWKQNMVDCGEVVMY
jgi:dsRNA-specific ribonuclease